MAFNAVHGGRLNESEFHTNVYACNVYAYSGGRLLLFMQEGVAFCWATSGARACAPIHTPPAQTHGVEQTHAHMQTSFFIEHAMFVGLQALKLFVALKS